MKNILHLIESSETGGAETIYFKLIKSINENKYLSHIGLLKYGWLFDELIKQGYTPRVFKSSSSFDIKLLIALLIYVKRHNIKMIHAHLFGIGVYASIVAMLCQIPVIVTLHGAMDANINDKYLKLKLKIVNRLATKVVFVSKYLARYYERMQVFHNSLVIYNGIEMPNGSNYAINCRTGLGLSDDDIIVGSVGDIRPPKGYEHLIRSAKILSSKYDNIKFVIAGSETPLLEDLRLLCSSLDLNDRVKFIGYRADICNIYNIMDIYLLPSVSEGFSLSTIEAMSHGIPVIVTRCGGPEEIVENRIDGILVEKENPEEMAQAIIELLEDNMLATNMVSRAKRKVKDSFTIDTMVSKYEKLYDNILQ